MWLEGEPEYCVGGFLAGVFDTLVAQHCGFYARGILAHKAKIRIPFIFCVTFLYFGPYFADIGHDFVETVKSYLGIHPSGP